MPAEQFEMSNLWRPWNEDEGDETENPSDTGNVS